MMARKQIVSAVREIILFLLVCVSFEVRATLENGAEEALPGKYAPKSHDLMDEDYLSVCKKDVNSCCDLGDRSSDERRCRCDSECVYIGNCCCNGPYFNPTTWRGDCVALSGSKESYKMMVTHCDEEHDYRSKCVNPDEADPTEMTPVSVLTQGGGYKTYRNKYCAHCDFEFKGLLEWEYHSNCSNNSSGYTTTNDTTRQSEVIRREKGCKDVVVTPSFALMQKIRPCYNESYVHWCPEHAQNPLCESEPVLYITTREPGSSVAVTYRNRHCLQCHGVKFSNVICAARLYSKDAYGETPYKRESIFPIWIEIGLWISIVFLILQICAVILVPEMHNLTGLNVASLCLALLCAFFCTVVVEEMFDVLGRGTLILFADFYTSSFTCMSVIAFELFRTFRAYRNGLDLDQGLQWKRFICYCIVAWGSPLVYFSLIYFFFIPLFHLTDGLVVFMVPAPIAVLMILNTGCFIYILVAMCRAPGQKANFRLYIKLFIVLGLAWIVSLLATAVHPKTALYLFLSVNCLKGIFIFFTFTMTPKIINGLSKRLPCIKKSSTFQTEAVSLEQTHYAQKSEALTLDELDRTTNATNV